MAIEFTSDNGISVTTKHDDEGDATPPRHFLEFTTIPHLMAGRLRELADFIDLHAAHDLVVEID